MPDLVPIRYGRMSLSAFHYFRGAAAVMASDLSMTPRTGLEVQMAGDAHLANFGLYATPEREVVFDANDFDETLPGPWEYDLKRLAASVVLAGRWLGLPHREVRRAAGSAAGRYREEMLRYAAMRYLDIWYSHLTAGPGGNQLSPADERFLRRQARRARRNTGLHAYPRLTDGASERVRIRDRPPLIVHYPGTEEAQVARLFHRRYVASLPEERRTLLERYRVADVAQKVVGVGSVGTRCSVLLLLADSDLEDPILLQVKEALPSVHEPHVGRSVYPNHAQRVVVGQHLVQETSDLLLGWGSAAGRDYYIRQLRDMTLATEVAQTSSKALDRQARLCGASLARAHARTGDPAAIGGYLGGGDVMDEAIADFALTYADQTERDFARFRAAVRKGELPATVDV